MALAAHLGLKVQGGMQQRLRPANSKVVFRLQRADTPGEPPLAA